MAFIDVDAILTRVREVCESTVPIVGRNVPALRFIGQFGIDESRDEMTRRALTNPRYDIRVVTMAVHPNQPPLLGTLLLYKLELEIKCVRNFEHIHLLSDAKRDDVLALAIQDGDVLGQSFQVYNVLAQTSGGTDTGVVSGIMRHEGTEIGELKLDPREPPFFIETVHKFSCVVQVTQTTIG